MRLILPLAAMSLSLLALALAPASVKAKDPDPKDLVKQAVKAAGGEDKLLKLFRVKESLNVSSDPEAKGKERTSVIEPPGYWWLGKKERVKDEKEPAVFLVWAWNLGILLDPKSELKVLDEIKEGDKPAFGLRVSGTVKPAMDLYFDKADGLLVRVDWRNDIHRFSEYKEHDGAKYASKVVGYKKSNGKPWYFTEVLKVERLKELPEGLKR
jgi:hypothetical protein